MQITEEKLVSILIQDSILRNAKIYGFEGIEDKIKDVYDCMPKLREKFLEEYEKMKGV